MNIILRSLFILMAFNSCGVMASPLTIEYSATIDQVNDSYYVTGNTFAVGQQITGTYTFDSEMPVAYNDDLNKFTEYRVDSPYPQPMGYTMNVGSLSLISAEDLNKAAVIFVDDDLVPWDGTQGLWDLVSLVEFSPGQINGLNLIHIGMDLKSLDGSAINVRDLPNLITSLNNFSEKKLQFAGSDEQWNWFDVQATISSIKVIGGPAPTDPAACKPIDKTVVAFETVVTYLDDDSGALAGKIKVGDKISGHYNRNINLPFNELNPLHRIYTSEPSDMSSGFILNAFGETIDTHSQGIFEVSIENDGSGYGRDIYNVLNQGFNVLLPDGTRIHSITIESNSSIKGDAINSVDIKKESLAPHDKWEDIRLMVKGQASNGNLFSINAQFTKIEEGVEAVEDLRETQKVTLTPASGVYNTHNYFSGELILPAGSPTVYAFGATVLNSNGSSSITCWDKDVSPLGVQTLRCDQMARNLLLGDNAVTMWYRDSSGTVTKFTNRYVITPVH